jgi:hypothetical protein
VVRPCLVRLQLEEVYWVPQMRWQQACSTAPFLFSAPAAAPACAACAADAAVSLALLAVVSLPGGRLVHDYLDVAALRHGEGVPLQ